MQINLIKAFTKNRDYGNPAGVIFDADNMSKEEMIQTAAKLNFSESVFITKPGSTDANYRFRFMTPTTEVDACGHATLAGSYALGKKFPFERIVIETAGGMIEVVRKENGSLFMKTTKSEIGKEIYDTAEIANLLGIDKSEINDCPIQTTSVGSPKLMIPIKTIDTIESIKPKFDAMIKFCKIHPVKGFYPFTAECKNKNSTFHARQFNPAAGIYEDPITGIAGGALVLYAKKYGLITGDTIIVEQGFEIGKPGEIIAEIKDGVVYIGGFCVGL